MSFDLLVRPEVTAFGGGLLELLELLAY